MNPIVTKASKEKIEKSAFKNEVGLNFRFKQLYLY